MEKARMNKEWREEYMTNMLFYWDALDDGREQGKEIGRELGREQGKLELLLKWIEADRITEEEAAEELDGSHPLTLLSRILSIWDCRTP